MLSTQEQQQQPAGNTAGCTALGMSNNVICTVCAGEYPHDRKHFGYHKKSGLSSVCVKCTRDRMLRNNQRAKEKRLSKLDAIESAGVDLYTKLAMAGGSNIPHSAELVEKLCQYFGGVSGFAAIMVKQYWDCGPGTSGRNKLLETITKLITTNVDSGGAKKPLTLWTEDELEAELSERFRLAVLSQRTIVDGTQAPEESQPADHALDADDDATRCIGDEGVTGGTERAATGGSEALPADPEAGRGPPLQGE